VVSYQCIDELQSRLAETQEHEEAHGILLIEVTSSRASSRNSAYKYVRESLLLQIKERLEKRITDAYLVLSKRNTLMRRIWYEHSYDSTILSCTQRLVVACVQI
jgi:hypothetical protein